MTPLLVVIGCPDQPWPIQLFTWTGGFAWLLILGALTVVVFERAQDWARRDGEGP